MKGEVQVQPRLMDVEREVPEALLEDMLDVLDEAGGFIFEPPADRDEMFRERFKMLERIDRALARGGRR